jgi:hypothetical protein
MWSQKLAAGLTKLMAPDEIRRFDGNSIGHIKKLLVVFELDGHIIFALRDQRRRRKTITDFVPLASLVGQRSQVPSFVTVRS